MVMIEASNIKIRWESFMEGRIKYRRSFCASAEKLISSSRKLS